MANNRKAGRSNSDQNLDNASTDMNQGVDQDIQSNDMNQRETPGAGSNQSQGAGQQQQRQGQQGQQDQTQKDRVGSNDSNLDGDASI